MSDKKRRWRIPADSIQLIIALSCVAGALAAAAVALAVWAVLDVHSALDANYTSRKVAVKQSCKNTEALKTDLRLILAGFDIDTTTLPKGPDGLPALTPVNCDEYTMRVVPPEVKP